MAERMSYISRQVRVVVLIVTLSAGASAFSAQTLSRDAFSLYASGSFEQFESLITSLNTAQDDGFREFDREAKSWLSATSEPRRSVVAVSVALEFAHALRDRPPAWGSRYIYWAVQLLRERQSQVPTETERTEYLACVATALELGNPWTLLVGDQGRSTAVVAMARDLGDGALVGVAQRRFPMEKRFDLVAASYLEDRNLRIDPIPALLALAQENVKLKVPAEPRSSAENTLVDTQATAAGILRSVPMSRQIRHVFEQLDLSTNIASDVELHLAVIDLRGMQFAASKSEFQQLFEKTDDPYILFLAAHFLGRLEHYQGHDDAAIAAFDRSLRFAPLARSSVTWLSALLLKTDSSAEHDRAIDLMTKAYRAPQAWDPLPLYERGEARNRALYLGRLREFVR